ncbi:MAG: hypothetical protein GEV07_09615 [Streptosporangiales bacterium]|nr:hypothetical protein [Streptosporangiales bacterium]
MSQAPDPARPTAARPGVGDLIGGTAVAVFGAAVVVYAQGFPELRDGAPGPGLFPTVVGGLLVFFGLVLVVRWLTVRLRSGAAERGTRPKRDRAVWINAGLVLASVVWYVLMSDVLGFALTMAVLLFVLSWRLGGRLLVAAGTAVLVPAAIYLVFQRLLLVPLPTGPFG